MKRIQSELTVHYYDLEVGTNIEEKCPACSFFGSKPSFMQYLKTGLVECLACKLQFGDEKDPQACIGCEELKSTRIQLCQYGGCEHWVCSDCAKPCGICEDQCCPEHALNCFTEQNYVGSHGSFCPNCGTECSDCEEWFCSDNCHEFHIENGDCGDDSGSDS